MPGYIRGFVEQEFADRWEFVCRVDPFTGGQGAFKYVFFGTGYASAFDPVVHTRGIPDDLGASTKLMLLSNGRLRDLDKRSNEDLHEEFQQFEEHMVYPRHVTLDQLLSFDWDRGLDDATREEMVEEGLRFLDPETTPERGPCPEWVSQCGLGRLFELVDTDGTLHEEWAPEEAGSWRERILHRDDLASILLGEPFQFDGRTARLRSKSRRELLPDSWFTLLELLARSHRDVRFVFYWHH